MPPASPAKARYANGLATLDEIVRAAEDVLADSGHAALSLRRVAEECGLKIGNISYYFPTKSQLIGALLDSIVSKYKSEMDALENLSGSTPEELIRRYMRAWIYGNGEVRTSKTFVEIWSMGNNDPSIRAHIDAFYMHGRQRMERLVGRLNPSLTPEQTSTIALYALASMEGVMVFANKEKPSWAQIDKIAANAIAAVIHLAKSPA